MRPPLIIAALCLVSIAAGAQTPIPPAIQSAVDNPARPAADRADDAKRKPAESLAFAGVKPGDKVVDMIPGRGYFTQLFCGVVGPQGHVYQLSFNNVRPPAPPKGMAAMMSTMRRTPPPPVTPPICAVTKLSEPDTAVTLPYHDLHNAMFGKPDMLAFDKAIYAALKPGGTFLVLDHAAAPGSGASVTETLHRIDPATVKQEVTAAGFVFDGESDVLRNPADDHSQPSYSLHGTTDQFIFKFSKPKA
jgi:predicted methyltransferase